MQLEKSEVKKVRRLIDKAIGEHEEIKPAYYVLTGSHLYGFPSENSDMDIRGFHVAPSEKHLKLHPPKEQIKINQDGITDGYEEFAEIDLVSYELRKFGRLLYKMNYNVLECIYSSEVLLNEYPQEMEYLRKEMKKCLPADCAKHYYGMAKSNYEKYLSKDRDSYTPIAKKYLYVLRGLLGARYVSSEGEVEPDIRAMCDSLYAPDSDIKDVVDYLVMYKKEKDDKAIPMGNRGRVENIIERLFEDTSFDIGRNDELVTSTINSWMLETRGDLDVT